MKKKLIVVAAGFFISSQLCAQDSTGKSLSEVIVTASKVQQKLLETGKVITIISKQTIERSAGKDIAQLLTEQAGIVINGATSNTGKDKSFYLRGAGNGYTVILIDGVPVNDPSFSGAFDLRMLPLDQVERIEIVKGAQSTLYGSDAVAGVVNIITKKGSDKAVRFYGNASAGSYNSYKFAAGVRGSVEKINYNLVYSHFDSKGISEAADTTKAKSFDKDGFLNNAISFTADAPIVKQLRILPFFRYSYIQGGYDGGAYTDAPDTYNSSLTSAGSALEFKYKKGLAKALFSYDKMERNYTSAWGPYGYNGNNKIVELFAHYQLNDHVKVLAGADYRFQQNLDSNVNFSSAYATLFLQKLNGFFLEAGGRYNKHSKYGNNFTYSINPSYVLNNNVKFFANVATAFKAPGISQLYGMFGANPQLKPEQSFTWEAGIQTTLLSNKADVRVVYFNRRMKDVIIYTTKYINLDEQNDHGIEIEPSIQFNKKLQLKMYYSFVDGNVTTKSPAGKDTTYFNLLRRPKHSVGATISYQATQKLFVSTGFNNYSKRSDKDFNAWPAKAVTLDNYFLWNMYAEYKLAGNKLSIFADAKNLLNSKYQEVYGYSATGFNFMAGIRLSL